MMAAAQVDPFQIRQQGRQLRLNGLPDPLQRLEPLFAQGVDVQAVDAVQMLGRQLRHRKAQARTQLAGVVLGDLALRMFRVQSQADVERLALGAGGGDQVGEAGDLVRGVEDDRVRQPQDLGQVGGLVGGGIGGQVALVELPRQPRLPQARGADAVEIFPDDVGQRPHGEGLQGQQHPGVRPRPDVLKDGQVATHRDLVDHEGGRRHAVQIEPGEGARSAGLGLHDHGRILRSPAERAVPRPSRAGRACSACP